MKNAKRCVMAMAALGLMLGLCVSASRADVVWIAPDLTMASPAADTSVPYTIQVNFTSAHEMVFSYGLRAELTSVGLTTGTVSFGTAAMASTNYIFEGDSLGYANVGASPTLLQATDGSASEFPTRSGLYNVITAPLNIGAGASGTWRVTFVPSPSTSVESLSEGFVPAGGYEVGEITIEAEVVPLPLAAWGGLALFGLVGAKQWRKGRQAKQS